MGTPVAVPTGHVYRVERTRGPAWYAKYRLPDGRRLYRVWNRMSSTVAMFLEPLVEPRFGSAA